MASKPLVVKIVGDADFSKASKKVGAFGKSIGGIFQGLGVGVGFALADGLGSAFSSALDIGAAQDKLAGQLGLTGAEAEKYGKIAGNLYAGAYGESLEQVGDVVASLSRTVFEDVEAPELEKLAGIALSMEGAFDGAATEYVQLAGQLQNQGVVRSVAEGLDFITTSFQQLPAAIQGDLTEAVDEYSKFTTALGFSTEETFGVLTQAAKGGKFELDQTGDALKEFQIRATDMSTASV